MLGGIAQRVYTAAHANSCLGLGMVIGIGLAALVAAIWGFGETGYLAVAVLAGVIAGAAANVVLGILLLVSRRYLLLERKAVPETSHPSYLPRTTPDPRSDIYIVEYRSIEPGTGAELSYYDSNVFSYGHQAALLTVGQFKARLKDVEALLEYDYYTGDLVDDLDDWENDYYISRRARVQYQGQEHWVTLEQTWEPYTREWVLAEPVNHHDRSGEHFEDPAEDCGDDEDEWGPADRPERLEDEGDDYCIGDRRFSKWILLSPELSPPKRTYPGNWDRLRRDVLIRDGNRCANCGADGGSPEETELHVHHIVPLSVGGTNRISNLVVLCRDCHELLHPHMREPSTAD